MSIFAIFAADALDYGASAAKIAKMLTISLSKAEQIIDGYWELNQATAEFKQACIDEWESNFKSFVRGIDGRKLMTRSKHSLVNIKIQSAGAIAMKLAMVWLDRELKKRNLVGNPFIEDITLRPTTTQMIAMHDEQQNRTDRSLIEDFKVFKDEAGAKEYKKEKETSTNKIYSSVGHLENGKYFVCYSVVGDLAIQSIAQAAKHLKLNVPLTGEYSVGKNWKDCH